MLPYGGGGSEGDNKALESVVILFADYTAVEGVWTCQFRGQLGVACNWSVLQHRLSGPVQPDLAVCRMAVQLICHHGI